MAGSLSSRRRALLVSVFGAVALLAAGFGAAQVVRSPEQAAAEAEGPGMTTLTVPVEYRELTATVVVRGDVAAGQQFDVAGPASEGSAVVTRVRTKPDKPVLPGKVLVEVAGRPVFALKGAVPAYRDLRPGYSGADVKQLQVALAALGFDPGERNGSFGAGTKAAVKRLYESLGYPVVQTSEEDETLVTDAADAIKEAERAVEDAEHELKQAKGGSDADDVGEGGGARSATNAVRRAREDLQDAKERHRKVIAETGPMVPLGEYFFVPSFPARVAAIEAKPGVVAPSPLMKVASGGLRAVGSLGAGPVELVAEGQAVEVVSESNGVTARGKVASIAEDSSGPTGQGGGGYQLVVKPVGDWSPKLSGTNVRLTIKGASTDGKTLVVPVSALFATADGATRVSVQRDGVTEDIPVTVDVHADGYAAIEPLRGEINEGDRVVLSADNIVEHEVS